MTATYHPNLGGINGPADPAIGHYYVDVTYSDKCILVAGPFHDHAAALAMVEPARKLIRELYANDSNSPWFAYGTCKMADTYTAPGKFNDKLGITL